MATLSEAFGGQWQDSPPSIREALSRSARNYPDKLALACLHQPSNLYGIRSSETVHLRWTYRQLDGAVGRLCARLANLGVFKGMAIVTFLGNGAEFVLSFWAAHRLGCPFVPLNPRNLLNIKEARHMLSVASAAAVVLDSQETAASFDSLQFPDDVLKLLVGADSRAGWTSFSELLEADARQPMPPNDTNQDKHDIAWAYPSGIQGEMIPSTNGLKGSDDCVTILFTSGTTSLPKGCPHTDLTLNAFMKNLALGGSSSNDVFCSVLPNNHAMGYFYVLYFFCHGGAVVYPSTSFDSAQLAQALTREACTHTCLVPTALHSLLDHISEGGYQFPALIDVCLAGASVTPQHMRQVINVLGAQGVSTGFGMTEGSPIWTAATPDPETLISGDVTISGSASPGTHIRICAPESTEPVPCGEPGEVHERGPGVIRGYLGDSAGSQSFYQDAEGKLWFRTGDQAVMHADGRVSIVGRYKDLIIRGGENIAPAAIETILNQFPGVEAQIVAAGDDIAGEVPVAVVKRLPDGDGTSKLLQDAVRTAMGALYVPDEFVTLATLGLDDFPRTMSGKVQKSRLQQSVANYRKSRNILGKETRPLVTQRTVDRRAIEETVLQVWWRATGIEPTNLDLQAPTSNFADSITILRVRDMYRKKLGLTLSAEEMAGNPNLHTQIFALYEKASDAAQDPVSQAATISGPPTLDDLQNVVGPENSASRTKDIVARAVGKYGFDWENDVESVIQTSDFTNVLIQTKVMDTWNFGIAIVAHGSTVEALRHALTVALGNNRLWPSFYVHGEVDSAPFYVTLKPSQKLYDQCLLDCGSLPSLSDLQRNAIQYPYKEHSVYPGPLFHALLYHIEELKSAAFVMHIHHAVHDASSMRLVLEDLNQALRSPAQPLRPHVPFRLWADMYHALRDSPRAILEVDWHIERLANIHLHRKALYPPACVARQATTESPDGMDYGFDTPALLTLKQKHPHITASVVLKAAMALVNITRTGHTHALFSNFEAARSRFPFWPDTLRHMPMGDGTSLADLDASDVDGPTMNAVTNLIEVPPDAPALDFLNRLQAEQTELTKRAHAPWRRIIEKLNAQHPGECAGEMLHQAHQTQFLTWVPGFLGEYEKIRVAQIAIRAALGLVFVAGLGGPQATTYMMSLRWDVANYSKEETEEFVKDVERAVKFLLESENWTRPVGDFLKQVG